MAYEIKSIRIYNEETIQKRIDELTSFIISFPDSLLSKIMENEINCLNAILDNKSKEEIEQLKALL